MAKKKRYLPALRFSWLTPLYDTVLRRVMREDQFKPELVRLAHIQPGQKVLDLGCGTGTLTILIKQAHPEAEVSGLDGDEQVLQIAREKAARAGADITFHQGMAVQIPYPDSSFDKVISSLLFHHLTREDKQRTLAEVYRTLTPGGEFYLADFGPPQGYWPRLVSRVMVELEEVSENRKGLLPGMMQQADLENVKEIYQFPTFFGTLAYLTGRKPPTQRKPPAGKPFRLNSDPQDSANPDLANRI